MKVRWRLVWKGTKYKPPTWCSMWLDDGPCPTLTLGGVAGTGSTEYRLEPVLFDNEGREVGTCVES